LQNLCEGYHLELKHFLRHQIDGNQEENAKIFNIPKEVSNFTADLVKVLDETRDVQFIELTNQAFCTLNEFAAGCVQTQLNLISAKTHQIVNDVMFALQPVEKVDPTSDELALKYNCFVFIYNLIEGQYPAKK